jgi:hypothetical protein
VFEQNEFVIYLNQGVGFIDKLQLGADTITFALFWYPCSTKELDCFGGAPIRGRSCQAQPCCHLI